MLGKAVQQELEDGVTPLVKDSREAQKNAELVSSAIWKDVGQVVRGPSQVRFVMAPQEIRPQQSEHDERDRFIQWKRRSTCKHFEMLSNRQICMVKMEV